LTDENLRRHGIDWLGSSAESFGFETPRVEGGVVKVPILFADFDLDRGEIGYQDWEEKVMHYIKRNDFVAIDLHDCYAEHWLPHYRGFLGKIKALGNLKTFDELATQARGKG
jgi:hypothetical protein